MTGGAVGSNRNMTETPKVILKRAFPALAAAAFAGSASADPLAALRADPATQTWECRAAVSFGNFVLPDDSGMPVTMTLAGHHGRGAGLVDVDGLPVIGTEFGLRGLSLAWTWEEGSYAIVLKPDTGVALHYEFPDDGTAVEPESGYRCRRTDGALRQAGNAVAPADTDDGPLTPGEREAFGLTVGQCWNVGSLSSTALATTVVVAFEMRRTGVPVTESIRMVDYHGGGRADANRAFGAARRAIIRCGTKGFRLPIEKYGQWREMTVAFSAEGMRFGQ